MTDRQNGLERYTVKKLYSSDEDGEGKLAPINNYESIIEEQERFNYCLLTSSDDPT